MLHSCGDGGRVGFGESAGNARPYRTRARPHIHNNYIHIGERAMRVSFLERVGDGRLKRSASAHTCPQDGAPLVVEPRTRTRPPNVNRLCVCVCESLPANVSEDLWPSRGFVVQAVVSCRRRTCPTFMVERGVHTSVCVYTRN